MRRLWCLIISFCFLLVFQSVSAAVFNDLASNHPHFTAINYLYENGIIEGYSDNTFRPEQNVNRVEALKIILLGSDIYVPEIQDQEIFPDVLHGTWYDKYVVKAKNLNIIKGDDLTGLFRPGDTVNLAEALKILLKTNNRQTSAPTSNPYLDVSKEAWFSPYFEYAKSVGLLDQSSYENVYPALPVDRGLLAELMYRLATNKLAQADGKASYYGEQFHGLTTANGEIFDASAFTAAHRTYPFDTWLKVTNVDNGESVVVRINDRGPYAGEDRIIDLSKAAFESISPLSRGVIDVKIELASGPSKPVDQPASSEDDLLNPVKADCPEAETLNYISKSAFENITLNEEIPTRLILDEVLTLKGSTSTNADVVSAFTVDSNENTTAFMSEIEDGQFVINIRFPKEGVYDLGVLPGESGSSIIKEVKVLKNTCIEETESSVLTPVSGLELDIWEGDTVVRWDAGDYNLFKLSFKQGGLHKSYILHNLNEWRPIYNEFESFNTGDVELSLRGAKLTANSILDPVQILWSPSSEKTFIASTHHEYNVNEDEVELISLTGNAIISSAIKAVFKPKVPIRSTAAVILPSGKVKDITIASTTSSPSMNQFDIEVYSASNESLTASYTAETTGIHFLEVNNAEGLAVINVPIYIRNQYPLIPSLRDLADKTPVDLGNNLTNLQTQMLNLVNSNRSDHDLGPLELDDSLNRLAQFRSDDMVQNNYFSHWDSQGRSANDLRSNYGIQTLVGENLAKDLNLELANDGLMRSAIHRLNILSEEWTRVGFGITKENDGTYVFVQIFSTDPIDLDDLDSLRNNILESINQNRISNLVLQSNLNTLSQTWSQKMVDEDFFDFTDGAGQSLVDTIRDAGVNVSLGTYIMGNSSFADALEQIGINVQLQESKWEDLGVGIKQDNLGIIKITLIYTE